MGWLGTRADNHPRDSVPLVAWRRPRHITWHFISHEPADRVVNITAMCQIKVASSQLTGAVSLVIPIRGVSYYLRV